MNITLKQLKAFVVVAQQESFMAACEMLHISQPALSIAIKNLEQEVGGSLLSRTTRAVVLTPEGEQFLPTAKRLLQEWDDAFIDLTQSFSLEHGMLSIAAMPSFASSLVPNYLKQFRQDFPQVKIKLHDVIAEDAAWNCSITRRQPGVGMSNNRGTETTGFCIPKTRDDAAIGG